MIPWGERSARLRIWLDEWGVTGHGKFAEALIRLTQGKLQAWRGQRSASMSPTFPQPFSPLDLVLSPSTVVPR